MQRFGETLNGDCWERESEMGELSKTTLSCLRIFASSSGVRAYLVTSVSL